MGKCSCPGCDGCFGVCGREAACPCSGEAAIALGAGVAVSGAGVETPDSPVSLLGSGELKPAGCCREEELSA